MTTTKYFAKGISYLAETRGIPQVVFADKTGKKASVISRVFSGKLAANDKLKDGLANVLGVEVFKIMELGWGVIAREDAGLEIAGVFKMQPVSPPPPPKEETEEEIDNGEIPKRLVEFRVLNHLSAKKVADITKTQVRTIYNYEGGSRKTHIDYLCKLQQNFNLNPTWLVTGEGSPYHTPTVAETVDRLRFLFKAAREMTDFLDEEDLAVPLVAHLKYTIESLTGQVLISRRRTQKNISLIKDIIEWVDSVIDRHGMGYSVIGEDEFTFPSRHHPSPPENPAKDNDLTERFQELKVLCINFVKVFS